MKNKFKLLLKIISIILIICFVGLLIYDYCFVYRFGSAPFYVYVLVRSIEFILPSLICFVISKKLK